MDVYGWRPMESDLVYVPLDTVPDESEELKNKLRGLISDLEANEDVLKVWPSVDLTRLTTGDYC
jgi:transcriptional/translational regulatory protein YebC/TACO1